MCDPNFLLAVVHNVSMDPNGNTNIIKCESVTGSTTGQTVRGKNNFKIDDVGEHMFMSRNKHDALGNVPIHRKIYAEIVQDERN